MPRALSLFVLLSLFATPAVFAQAPQFTRDYVYGPGGRLALTVEPDNYPPQAPPNFSGFDNCGIVSLNWNVPVDIGSGVSGYYLYRDGNYIGGTSSTSFSDNVGGAMGTYHYEVEAYDVAGHVGPRSETWVDVQWCGFGSARNGIFFPEYTGTYAGLFPHVRLLVPVSEDDAIIRVARFREVKLAPRLSARLSWTGGGL